MRITEQDIDNATAQATPTIHTKPELSGIHHVVARYIDGHPDASLDDVAELTFRGRKYVPSSEAPPTHHPDMLIGTDRTYYQWQSDAGLSAEWRRTIQKVMEEVS